MSTTKPDWKTIAEEAITAGNIPAVLEIDSARGVIYVHDAAQGITAIRICGLPAGIVAPIDMTVEADGVMISGTYMLQVPHGPLVMGPLVSYRSPDKEDPPA
jgi:hypothetical protein